MTPRKSGHCADGAATPAEPPPAPEVEALVQKLTEEILKQFKAAK